MTSKTADAVGGPETASADITAERICLSCRSILSRESSDGLLCRRCKRAAVWRIGFKPGSGSVRRVNRAAPA